MRFLLGRTDAMGDVIISLPVASRILSRSPSSEIHWLVSEYTAPLLMNHPNVNGVHIRTSAADLHHLMTEIRPDAVLTLSHRDSAITVAASKANIPTRVARSRGVDQIFAATHLLWKGRSGKLLHESQHALEFLSPWHWQGGVPEPPRLHVTSEEIETAERDLVPTRKPRLGLIARGSGAGAFPSRSWWERALPTLEQAGWNPVVLSPPSESPLPGTDLRGLLARLAVCQAVLGPSTGPVHAAAALGVPTLCMMGLRNNHAPQRWAPLGPKVQVIQYPAPEADLRGGMDRLDPLALIPHLERLR